jgi:DNA-binding transcriptional MerR regulator
VPKPPDWLPPWRIGGLSERTGVSVRALHHYDSLGLLKASHRSRAGHRLYGRREIERLQQIRSLRQLGLSLEEIRQCLASRTFSARQVVERHLAAARAALSAQGTLVRRLESLQTQLARGREVPIEEFVTTVEAIIMTEQYFTPEQQEILRTRREMVGADRIRHVEQHEWPTLIADVKAEMDKGTDPVSPAVKALARRWSALVEEFTGGDKGVAAGVRRQYQAQDPNPAQRHGMPLTREMFQYIGRAMEN